MHRKNFPLQKTKNRERQTEVCRKPTGIFSIKTIFSFSSVRHSLRSASCRYSVIFEQKCNTPDRRESHDYIHYSAEYGSSAAEKPRNKVEAENTYKTPVESSDNKQHKCNFIKHFIHPFIIAFIPLCTA